VKKQYDLPELGGPADVHFKNEFKIDPATVKTDQKTDLCSHLVNEMAKYDTRIANAIAVCMNRNYYRMFADRNKLYSSNHRVVTLAMVAIARKEAEQAMNFDSIVGSGFEVADTVKDKVSEVPMWAIKQLGAKKIEPGIYTVIFDPDMSGLFAHESFGHGLERDTMLRGAARAILYVGKRVGSDLVTIVDFGGIPGKHGTIPFSDDGVLTAGPTILVENGILLPTAMTDVYCYTMLNGRVPGLVPTANGRCENFGHPMYSRMTNTYFAPLDREHGGVTFEEMLDGVTDGVYVQRCLSGMEDPLGWGVQLEAVRGRRIRNGKLTDEIYAPVGITGNVPDILGSVDKVGDTLYIMGGGTCGKGHKEMVRVASGGPFIRCKAELG
jgi:TldD protein